LAQAAREELCCSASAQPETFMDKIFLSRFTALLLCCTWSCVPTAATAQSAGPPSLALALQASGLVQPLHITHAGDGSGRLFVVEQAGRIRILEGRALLPAPFLDISDRVSCCGERGLLSVAFPPDYASKGHFYVDYTDLAGDTVVARYRVGANPDLADPASEQVVLKVPQPFPNHNGGQLAFGPDGFLYIGLGDGGSGGDPQNNAQNPGTLLGKILRIDVESGANPYAVPPNNPLVGVAGAHPEIWALGLRNPWRFSFDRQTGDLYIGDVGQNAFEEIDFQPAASPGGENYGWRIMEGLHCFNPKPCSQAGLTLPVAEYDHTQGCSVTGGAVYRGTTFPRLQGTYVYGDFCSGRLWGLRFDGTSWHSAVLLETGRQIASFGEDQVGGLYLADYGSGQILKLVDQPPAPAIRANFESPQEGPVAGIDLVRGWAFASEPSADIATVSLILDEALVRGIPCCSARPDVEAAFPAAPQGHPLASGWGVTVNWGALAPGGHSVRVEYANSSGAVLSSDTRIVDVVRPGEFEFLDQLDLSGATARTDGQDLVLERAQVRDQATQQWRTIDLRLRWFESPQAFRPVQSATVASNASLVSWPRALLAALRRSLLALTWLPSAQAQTSLQANWESPVPGQTVAGVGLIRGWAFPLSSSGSPGTVQLLVDGQPFGEVPCCSQRPDVSAAFPASPQALASGWGITFNYGRLAAGPHTVAIALGDPGATAALSRSVQVIRPGDFEFLDRLDLSGATARTEGQEVVLEGVAVRDAASATVRAVDVRLRWLIGTQSLELVAAATR
jgi:glucose/arabinose dehydrogenase